jgi:hypothetical protein
LLIFAWVLAGLGCSGPVPIDTVPDTEVDTEDGLGQETDDPTVDKVERELNLASKAGEYAYDFVSGESYQRLIVEVDFVSGRPPSQPVLEQLADELERVFNKPGGVAIEVDDRIPAQGNPTWVPEAAEELEVAYRDRYRGFEPGTAVMYFLYLDGQNQSDAKILGYAPHGSSAYVFDREVDKAQAASGHANPIDQGILLNLAGRMAGLVDRGLPMVVPHEDSVHPGFSDDPLSVMFHTVSTTEVAVTMKDNPKLAFDEHSLADLKNVSGK